MRSVNDTRSPTGASGLRKILMRYTEADRKSEGERDGEIDNQSSLPLVFRSLPCATSAQPPFGGGNSAVIAVDGIL